LVWYHFATSPFHEQEMKIPGIRTLTTNYEILGGPDRQPHARSIATGSRSGPIRCRRFSASQPVPISFSYRRFIDSSRGMSPNRSFGLTR